MNLNSNSFSIIVVGGTPGGITAAITAARLGRKIAIIEAQDHIGGMTTSGLGKSDVEQKQYIGGLFLEFTNRVYQHYRDTLDPDSKDLELCMEGYYYEPSVAEKVLNEMIEETGDITVLTGHRLKEVKLKDSAVQNIIIQKKDEESLRTLKAEIFVDATYEGDLYAKAGADYRVGREARSEYGEPHAGIIYYDYENGEVLPGSTGKGDNGIQAYTYRFCLTTDPDNSFILEEPPPEYNRETYTPYFKDLEAGRLSAPKDFHEGWGYYADHFDTLVRALSVTELPNSKIDANINPRPLAFPFPEENEGYIDGDSEERENIAKRHRNLSLGLLWFLQNDKEIPEEHKKIAQQYHLPLDEFEDNNHFPYQLYVREGRRLKGEYTITEHDVAITEQSPEFQHHDDTIAVGEFPIDSFPVHKKEREDQKVLEGYLGMLAHLTRPYEIPYRSMIPQKIDNLIVPVALSATHVGFSSIRMEPTWMTLGQAAGVAAHICLKNNQLPRNASVSEIQELLEKQGQVLDPKLNDE
ncbi:FAD-dependent oxidoreductase [Halalkalibaculum sp. DA384]|uniref:FAD-dependent oxidoreductase n=1 Tax=Halalkalibaculum sp. DA384 TaxID=3373606 RepID=UPI003754D34C